VIDSNDKKNFVLSSLDWAIDIPSELCKIKLYCSSENLVIKGISVIIKILDYPWSDKISLI